MKKILLLAAAAIMAAFALQAKDANELRFYINPGHGSWGPNDRPMETIPYPMLPETGRPDTCGFYESNTNLWKCLRLREELVAMGVDPNNITMSRVKNGPFPYVYGAADAEIYNRPLSEICEEVEVGNYDMFISIHSNASTDGTATNYPLYLYRGYDAGQTGGAGYTGPGVEGSDQMALTNWPYH
ncbi:MAG: N-acetylmuramoyl-L-alanine amidase, partial [Muribaculaceae bacterium]|nr:N-acetylmuramoyl-L-alanine amidase [Muribaculaceae bacterium]